MKKLLFIAVIIGLFSTTTFAQSGNVKIGIGAETNFFASNNYSTYYDAGFGGNIKGFYGLNNASDLTFTAGIPILRANPACNLLASLLAYKC